PWRRTKASAARRGCGGKRDGNNWRHSGWRRGPASGGAIFSRKFTSATLSLPDPVPFFAELSLWISSEVYHGNKKRRISSSLTLAMCDLNNRSRERKEYPQRRTPPMLQRRRMFVLRS